MEPKRLGVGAFFLRPPVLWFAPAWRPAQPAPAPPPLKPRMWAVSEVSHRGPAVRGDALIVRAGALMQSGRLQAALDDLEAAQHEVRSDAGVLANRAALLCVLGRPEEALLEARAAVRMNPQMPEARIALGNAQFALGEAEAALATYSEAMRLEPRAPIAVFDRGNAQRLQGRWSAALSDYSEAILRGMQGAAAWGNRAGVLRELKRPREALEALDRAAEADPEEALTPYLRAHLLLDQDRAVEAECAARQALELEPELAHAQVLLGNALLRQCDLAGAKNAWKSALDKDFTHAAALHNLARLDERSCFTGSEPRR